MKRIGFLLLAAMASAVFSCTQDPPVPEGDKPVTLQIPKGFPYPEIPEDNQLTQNRISLGEKLFFDPILSRDSTVSCGTCHQKALFFTDNLAVSVGIDQLTGIRNAPSLFNLAYHTSFFWDGGVPTMEQQVLAPIENPLEMDLDVNAAVQRLQQHPEYPQLFRAAYDRDPDLYSLTRAIACYERTLLSGNSRYDRYLQYGDTDALNASEINGMNLFFGERGECFHCHGEFNFTDNTFQNNGLYSVYADSGRARITLDPDDYGKFKVPSLRNVDKTFPYMHDGSLATLEEVVEHYNSGGKPSATKSPFIFPLNLTEQEKQDLVNFLKALTEE